MKKLAITMTLFGLAALTAVGQQSTAVNTSRSNVKNNMHVLQGPGGKVLCTSTTAGKTAPCTAGEVAQLNKALASTNAAADRRIHEPITVIREVSLAKDGSLMCTTVSGKVPCSSTHLPGLKQADSRVNSELEQVDAPASQK